MKYVIARLDDGTWTVNVFSDAGQLGAQVLCSSTTQAMDMFLMLAGSITLEDERREYDEITRPINLKAVV